MLLIVRCPLELHKRLNYVAIFLLYLFFRIATWLPNAVVVGVGSGELMQSSSFDQWREQCESRFAEGYFDKRLEREQRKACSITSSEVNRFRKWFVTRRLIGTALRFSGQQNRGARNALDIQLLHNQLKVPQLPESFVGYRILQISDPHFNNHAGFIDNLITRVQRASFDLCVLTGDYRYRSFGTSELALEGLQTLTHVINTDIIAVLGNHDSITSVPAMERMGITVLLNEHMLLRKAQAELVLLGVDDPHYYRTDDISYALNDAPSLDKHASILLAHSPECYEQATQYQIGAYLCGHTHGGQICLSPGKALLKNFRSPDWTLAGAWQHKQLSGYTSAGVGTSTVNARFNCQPSITVHELICD